MQHTRYERPLTFFDIFGAVFRYRWRSMFVAGLVMALMLVAIFLYPKKYESESTLFVRLGRSSASMDPATIGQTISIQESREAEMNSIVNLLESRGLAERVVAKVGADRLLKKYAWIEKQIDGVSEAMPSALKSSMPAMEEGSSEDSLPEDEIDARKEFELAVIEFAENLKIDSPKKSLDITVKFRARTPELARDVVQAVWEVYESTHIVAYQSGGALKFFEEQFQEQSNLVSKLEDDLRKTKNDFNIVTMAGKQESIQSEFTQAKRLLLETNADLDAAIAQSAKYAADLKKLPTSLLSQKTLGIAENATDAMKDRLNSLEVEEKQLAAKYVSTHPELVLIREQIRTAREIVEAQPEEREQSVVSVNPVWMDIENKLIVAQAEVARLGAKVASLEQQEMELAQRLNGINDLEVQAFEMQRKIDIARLNYTDYARKLEEARINAALDREALSNVSVVNPPSLRFKQASPKRSVLALLAIMLSGLSGLAVALISDYFANAKEMRAIREAEQLRYLRALEEDSSPRTLTVHEREAIPQAHLTSQKPERLEGKLASLDGTDNANPGSDLDSDLPNKAK